MATLPPRDPQNFSAAHVLRRAPGAEHLPEPSVPPRWRAMLAKLLSGVQFAALLYGFFLFALLAGASPFTDHAGSGAIAIPGLPWFYRAFIAIAAWWIAGVARQSVLNAARPWRYGLTELGWTLWLLGILAVMLIIHVML